MPMWHTLSIILSIKDDEDIPKAAIAKEGKVRSNVNRHSQPISVESAQHKSEGYSLLGRRGPASSHSSHMESQMALIAFKAFPKCRLSREVSLASVHGT